QYPQLRATGNIGQLQEELTSTENKVAFARQLSHDTATLYKTKQQQVPASLVAGLGKAPPADPWGRDGQRVKAWPQGGPSLQPTGPQKVLWSTRAREIVEPRTAQERQLVNVVEEMALAAGAPRPRIWTVGDPDPNAFATGTDPLHSHIAVTQGVLDLCTRDELQGVVAHELGHVKNLDIRLMTMLAALVGAVALMHDGTSRVLRPGGGSSEERKPSP